MIAAALARHLTAQGIVDYRANQPGGDTFLDELPSTPDRAVMLGVYRANEIDGIALHAYDEPVVQILTRAPRTRDAHDLAHEIFAELIGITSQTIAADTVDEAYVVLVTSDQSEPYHLPGTDDNGRHTYTQNLAVHHRVTSTHRV